jgi:hypothetical protein
MEPLLGVANHQQRPESTIGYKVPANKVMLTIFIHHPQQVEHLW